MTILAEIQAILSPDYSLYYLTTVCITALPFTEIVSFEKAIPSGLSPSHFTDCTSTECDLAPCEPPEMLLCL